MSVTCRTPARAARSVLLALPTLLGCTLAAAAPDDGGPAELPIAQGAETVVTASRVPELRLDSLSALRVITAEDLRSSGAQSLGDVLRQFAGVEVASNGGLGQPTSVFMRGANSSHTLVLVDGLRLQSSSSGTTAFEHIPVSQIARIEVLPGPASGLYGSDAIGGVIQIFTRSAASAPGSEVQIEAGSYRTGRIQAGTRGSLDGLDYGVSLGYLGSDAFPATNSQAYASAPGRDDYRDRNADAQLGWHYLPGHVVSLRYLQSVAATRFVPAPDSEDVSHQSLSQLALTSEDQLAPGWTSRVRFGVARDSAYSLSYGTNETVQREWSWQNTVTLPAWGTLVAGLDALNEAIQADPVGSSIPVTARDTRAVFLGYSAALGPFSTRASLRHADNAQFGGVNTGTLAFGYRASEALLLRASYGSAFHAPSFNDLYISYPAPPFPYFANPGLRPERSHNSELGAEVTLDAVHVGISAFDNQIEDLITITSDFSTVSNLAHARIRGLELSADGPVAAGRWDLHATFQDPQDRDSGSRLPRRAARFATGRVSQAWLGVDWAVEAQAFGERYDASNQDPAKRMGGYALWNLIAGHRFTPEWRGELRWNNVSAHRYTLAQGYNVPGSTVFASLVWSTP